MRSFLLNILALTLLSNFTLSQERKLDIQGHRGARGLMPENTIPAFKKAIDEGVTTLELDVVITKDNQVVVSHEPYMSASICSKPNGEPVEKKEAEDFNIYQMTYAEVAAFDCGSRGNERFPLQEKQSVAKPLLSEMITQAEAYAKEMNVAPLSFNIEIKSTPKGDGISHPQVPEFSKLVYETINKYLPKERFTLQSFDFRVLQYWHKEYPDVTLVALIENMKSAEKNVEALGFTPEIYSPYYKLLSRKKVEAIHEMGMKVVPWTVNTKKEMEALVEMGVDGIITDFPDIAKTLKP